MGYALGNQPYGAPITTVIGTTQTRIYELGPLTVTTTTKFLIMANVSLVSGGHNVQLTVGRATTTGASAANSTNIVSNTSPVSLPIAAANTAFFMAALSHGAGESSNLSGSVIDAPGAGTFYYTIWMSSSSSHTYGTMRAFLTVLKILA
jgi:hypothetical protein